MKIPIGLECLSHMGLPVSLVPARGGEEEEEEELVAMRVCDT